MQLARFLNKVFKKSGFILIDANNNNYIIGEPKENPIKVPDLKTSAIAQTLACQRNLPVYLQPLAHRIP